MSSWFSIRLAARPGSLAAALSLLAAAEIAVEGIVGSPEAGDGEVHLGVDASRADAAIATLRTAGITAHHDANAPLPDAHDAGEAGIELGIIGAILRGPLG